MKNLTHSLPQTIKTLIVMFSILVSTYALAQDNTYAPVAPALQSPSNNDCYKGDRNTRFMLRFKDISSLWHYATHILRPTAGASALPRNDADARKAEKGVVWRVGTENGAVVVSGKLAW